MLRATARSAATLLLLALSCACSVASGQLHDQPAPPPGPAPSLRIPVAPLGYESPNAFYLTARLSSASLGFFDQNRLLFTFRIGGLLPRLPSDRSDDDDQEIRAVVLDLRTGKVLAQTQWRMHDRGQYLWPFIDGQFLLRIRDSLFTLGPSLELHPWMTSSTQLRAVELSPDRATIAIETSAPPQPHTGPTLGDAPVSEDQAVHVSILASASPAHLLAVSQAEQAVLVPLTSHGLLDATQDKLIGLWDIHDVPFRGSPRFLGNVRSTCHPTVQPLSATVALVSACAPDLDLRPVYGISTVTGKELWQANWQSKYVWGWFDCALDGSRFAYESIESTEPVNAFGSLDEGELGRQLAGVYDTDTGKPVLVLDATPVLSAGQNLALSPDGRRLAILRHGAIEVYDLPPVAPPAPAAAKRHP
ncbi:MAG: hypothetical protein WBG54_21620 [Acidobacteriaceae bacterium]